MISDLHQGPQPPTPSKKKKKKEGEGLTDGIVTSMVGSDERSAGFAADRRAAGPVHPVSSSHNTQQCSTRAAGRGGMCNISIRKDGKLSLQFTTPPDKRGAFSHGAA